MIHPSNTYDIVVVGASAGGVEALSLIVGGLPSDFAGPTRRAHSSHLRASPCNQLNADALLQLLRGLIVDGQIG